MKTTAISLLAAAVFSFSGCSKSSSDPQPAQPNPTGYISEIKATVGSSSFSATTINNVAGTHATLTTPGEAPARLILRGNVGNNRIILTVSQFTGAGTYTLVPQGPSLATYYENFPSDPIYSTQHMPGTAAVGQVVVSTWNPAAKRAKGTFSFSGRVRNAGGTFGATQAVTAGTFDVYDILIF